MQKEVVIKLSGDGITHRKKFLCYAEGVTLSPLDPVLLSYLESTRDEVKFPVEECEIIVKMLLT